MLLKKINSISFKIRHRSPFYDVPFWKYTLTCIFHDGRQRITYSPLPAVPLSLLCHFNSLFFTKNKHPLLLWTHFKFNLMNTISIEPFKDAYHTIKYHFGNVIMMLQIKYLLWKKGISLQKVMVSVGFFCNVLEIFV